MEMDYSIYPTENVLKHLLSKIKSSKLSSNNKKALLEWYNYMLAKGLGKKRILKCLQLMFIITKRSISRDYKAMKIKDMEQVIAEVNQRRLSAWSKHDYKVIIKLFYRWLINGNGRGDYPAIVAWISTKMAESTKKLPEDLLTEADVRLLIKHAKNVRDKALIGCLYESGVRVGELLSMTIKNITFDDLGAVILVTGKTGARRVRCDVFATQLQTWLDNHPEQDNRDAFVWASVGNRKKLMKYSGVRAMLQKCAKRAGVEKRVSPHQFRHSRATHIANHFSDAQMKAYFGWVQSSEMASVYIHTSGKDIDAAFRKLYGKHKEAIKPRESSIKCPKCQRMSPPNSIRCQTCSHAFTTEALIEDNNKLAKMQQGDDVLHKLISELVKVPTLREGMLKVMQEAKIGEQIEQL